MYHIFWKPWCIATLLLKMQNGPLLYLVVKVPCLDQFSARQRHPSDYFVNLSSLSSNQNKLDRLLPVNLLILV